MGRSLHASTTLTCRPERGRNDTELQLWQYVTSTALDSRVGAFASMAETMVENQTGLDERFEADQYRQLVNMIWDELQRDDDNPHYPYFATVPNAGGGFAAAVSGRPASELADHCYVGECLVFTQDAIPKLRRPNTD